MKSIDLTTTPRKRRGTSLLEMMISLLILMSVATALAQLLMLVSLQRRTAERRQLASIEATNLMEHLFARPWDQLTANAAAEMKLSEQVISKLPQADLKVEISPLEKQPQAVRIVVEVRWQNRAGEQVQPTRLSAWRYRDTSQTASTKQEQVP